MSEPATPADLAAHDRALIVALAAGAHLHELTARPEHVIIAVGDGETSYELVRDRDDVVCVEVQRGHRSPQVRFGSVADAVRYLVFTLVQYRFEPELTPIRHADFAPGTAYAVVGEDRVLRWPGGEAVVPRGGLRPDTAREFSWVVSASPADIAASYRHPNGEPLFDLGLGDRPRPAPTGRPSSSTLKPRPVETPPADPSAGAEIGPTLAAAAEIGMTPRPLGPGDLLAVGWDHSGRFVSYRHGAFQYQSGAGDRRTILATTSTAAAARRLLVIEAAAIARTHRRQQPVHLRVRGPAADSTLTRGPTELVVEGPGVRATFPLGPVGHQRALVFSYCANAALEDILASYRHPDGAPLLTPGLHP